MSTTEALCESARSLDSLDLDGRLLLLRSLRAAAAASSSDALLIIQSTLPHVFKYVMEAERITEDKSVVCIVCQVFANVLAHGSDTHSPFFDALGFPSLLHLLVTAAQADSRNGIAAVIAGVHSVITHDPNRSPDLLGDTFLHPHLIYYRTPRPSHSNMPIPSSPE